MCICTVCACSYCMCVCVRLFAFVKLGPAFLLQSAAVKAQRMTFPFFPMQSSLRRYLNIPRVRCMCSPACIARVFPLPLPACLRGPWASLRKFSFIRLCFWALLYNLYPCIYDLLYRLCGCAETCKESCKEFFLIAIFLKRFHKPSYMGRTINKCAVPSYLHYHHHLLGLPWYATNEKAPIYSFP